MSRPSAAADVRRMAPEDANELVILRREALEQAPLAFGSSLQDDRGLSVDFVRSALEQRDEQAVFGYYSAGVLSGMAGLVRETKLKSRHKAFVWGMYVSAHARGTGAGRALVQAVVAHARSWSGVEQVHLSVSATAVEAGALYTSMGFHAWGREPRALQWEGRFVDEIHLALRLV
ncbi:MAG: GNAT family N-acetyltransferase [Gammaproteobacteria bacterium]